LPAPEAGMSRVRLLFSEAWSSITANISTTFAATMTVLIGMFLLGLFIALGTWVLSWSDHIKKELQVKIYFTTAATDQQEVAVGQSVRRLPHVKHVVFMSKERAFAEQSKKYPDLYAHVTSNPLPDAWIVTPIKGEYTPDLGRRIKAADYPGVDDVNWGSGTAKRVLTIAEVIWIAFLVAVVLLVVASTLLIANTIRLSIFARRREIEVMKLVGATNWFVRGPFMLEGLLCGVIGAVAAVVLLVIGKEVALPALLPHIGGGSDVHALPFPLNALALVVAGLLLGAAGSGLTMRRFLQV
jgi:cell division transport system permease protein